MSYQPYMKTKPGMGHLKFDMGTSFKAPPPEPPVQSPPVPELPPPKKDIPLSHRKFAEPPPSLPENMGSPDVLIVTSDDE